MDFEDVINQPLLPPHLEPTPGWLAPNGDYYPCNYEAHQRHGTTAWMILDMLGIEIEHLADEQNALCELRFICVDIEECLMAKGYEPSERQINTLRQLMLLPEEETDYEWQHYTKQSIDAFLRKIHIARRRQQLKRKKFTTC